MGSLKTKTLWFCTECGYESTGYVGKCPSCAVWSSFKEAKFTKDKSKDKNSRELFINAEAQLVSLSEISEEEIARQDSKLEELNRVLGGGIVPGSMILLGGEPGIGKSTILLQVANNFGKQKLKVLYISAEESSRQLKMRASRLGINSTEALECISVLAENNLSKVIDLAESEEPSLMIVDSIQAVYLPNIDSVPGSPSQIRECCGNLMRLAKTTNIPIIIVGHINKEGDIAGPKILEHMVDTVLQFEGKQDSPVRILRSIKNRFGSTNEVGLFNMTAGGLSDLANPSEIFLEQRSEGMIFASKEGKRSLLLEIQALVLHSNYPNPRRLANGIEIGRLHQILAILEKKLKVNLSLADTYINVVGAFQIIEPAADLAVALAIYKSAENLGAQFNDVVAIGELGLSGEIRSVTDIQARVNEAIKLGFKKIIIPKYNLDKLDINSKEIELIGLSNIEEMKNYKSQTKSYSSQSTTRTLTKSPGAGVIESASRSI